MKLEGLKDEHIATLLAVAKTNKALRPFFGTARGMIALREEAARRNIYRTESEKVEVVRKVYAAMGSPDRKRGAA